MARVVLSTARMHPENVTGRKVFPAKSSGGVCAAGHRPEPILGTSAGLRLRSSGWMLRVFDGPLEGVVCYLLPSVLPHCVV